MRFFKPGRLLLYLLIAVIFRNSLFSNITLEKDITIKKGQSASVIYQDLGRRSQKRLQRSFRQHSSELANLQPGTYEFTGSYTADQVVDILLKGPKSVYQRITLLEGRNIRDIDKKLTDEGLISAGSYVAFVTDSAIINKYTTRYSFLSQASQERGGLKTLEGYLYPETYLLDPSKDVVDQLVYLQLEAFQDRVWEIYGTALKGLSSKLASSGYTFKLSTYGALILASIIEKEERVVKNKPIIASIFFNRLEAGMRLDADISLCYGLQIPYDLCTPTRIAAGLGDKANPYNTRAVTGLPPTPIANIQANSLSAVLEAPKSDLLFYLHNKNGELFTAKTLSDHNSNISKELR